MLYVLYGTDTSQVLSRARVLADSLRMQGVTARHTIEGDDESVLGRLETLAHARALFDDALLIFLRFNEEKNDGLSWIAAHASDIASSANHIVVTAGRVPSDVLTKLRAHASVCEEYKSPPSKAVSSIFNVSDALFAHDRKLLWMAYMRALREGYDAHAIHGTLFWAVKSMLLVHIATGKPPQRKVFEGARRFNDTELRSLLRDLVVLYHESHRGRYNLAIALERWILRGNIH